MQALPGRTRCIMGVEMVQCALITECVTYLVINRVVLNVLTQPYLTLSCQNVYSHMLSDHVSFQHDFFQSFQW